MQWAGEEYLLEELAAVEEDKLTKIGEVYSKDIMYWINH